MSRQPAPTDLPLRHAGIALLPILVFLVSEAMLLAFAHNAVSFPEGSLASGGFSDPGEAAARLKLLGMAFLALVGCIAILCKFVSDLRTWFAGPARRRLYLAYGMVVAVGIVFLALTYSAQLPLPRQRLGEVLFERVFQGLTDDRSIWSAYVYERFIAITHLAVLLAMAAFVAGAISCLARLPGLSDEDNWKYQSERLKTYIYLSAAYLAVSVLYFKSWADYPAFLLSDPSLRPTARSRTLTPASSGSSTA